MRGMICLSIFRLDKIDDQVNYLEIKPYLILNDSSGSNGKETPATSCAPVSTWSVSIETRANFSSYFSLKEPIFARDGQRGARGEKVWRGEAVRTNHTDISAPGSYRKFTLTRHASSSDQREKLQHRPLWRTRVFDLRCEKGL